MTKEDRLNQDVDLSQFILKDGYEWKFTPKTGYR